jgi:uncharacterized membrane protein
MAAKFVTSHAAFIANVLILNYRFVMIYLWYRVRQMYSQITSSIYWSDPWSGVRKLDITFNRRICEVRWNNNYILQEINCFEEGISLSCLIKIVLSYWLIRISPFMGCIRTNIHVLCPNQNMIYSVLDSVWLVRRGLKYACQVASW